MAGKNRSQPLPKAEEGLFKQVVKLYEAKQFKKATKTADQILKKVSDHGETLAMKALVVSNLPDRRDDAHELARAALKADIKSYVCWHVYGMLHRNDRAYEQAAACYLNALSRDPENLTVCRDLATLQLQLRDISGLIETAGRLLALKSNQQQHWFLLAVAHHLAKNYAVAVQVLDAYLSTIDANAQRNAPDRYETSEIHMYKAKIQLESGEPEAAAQTLLAADADICDRVGRLEMLAGIALRLGNSTAAAERYHALIAAVPDNYEWHRGLCESLGLPATASGAEAAPEVAERLDGVYKELAALHPGCSAAQRIPLDFLGGSAFAAAARSRIADFASRGVPALFSDLRPLLQVPDKAAVLEREAMSALEAAQSSGDAGTALWLRLYLAQHASHLGRTGDALTHIAAAESSPALASGSAPSSRAAIDVFSAKAGVLAAAGDWKGAAAAADVARQLDPKDRYVNSVATRHMFRAGRVDDAKATALLFARDADDAGTGNLFDMQVMWYEVESGRAHLAKGELGMALKMFTAVITHFADIAEDQFDFHMYCLRKVTLRAYLELLSMEDRLYSHEAYSDAALGAIDCYIRLHRDPPSRARAEAEAAETAEMSDAQRKKFLDKRRKEAAKVAKEAAEKQDRERAAHIAKRSTTKFDEDPRGEKLVQAADPLGEADKLLQTLKAHAAHRTATHEAAFEVALLQDKPFLALHAVKHARHLDAEGPPCHCLLVRLVKWLVERTRAVEPATASEVLTAELDALTGGRTAEGLNESYRERHSESSIRHLLAISQMQSLLDPAMTATAASGLAGADLAGMMGDKSVDACEAAYTWLKVEAQQPEHALTFHRKAQTLHRWSAVFDDASRDVSFSTDVDALVSRIEALSTA